MEKPKRKAFLWLLCLILAAQFGCAPQPASADPAPPQESPGPAKTSGVPEPSVGTEAPLPAKETEAPLPPEETEVRNYVYFDGDSCFIKAKYSADSDLVFVVGPGGGNGLPDIRRVYTVLNSGPLNEDLRSAREVIPAHDTDIIGPHIVAAANNGDGDAPEAQYFTGGNHRTNNAGTGGAVTARNAVFLVLCGGEPLNGSAYCADVEIFWVNYIQGYNTSKASGSGREILQEDVRLKIRGTDISVTITHTALEDLIRKTYYGPQMLSSAYGRLQYAGADASFSCWASSRCADKNCRSIRLFSDRGDILEMGIDPGALGSFNLNRADHSAFNESYGKCYFNLIRDAEFLQQQGVRTFVSGYYRFGFEAA